MKDTVAIIGSHPRTRNEFDFTRDDCDIWIFNEALSNGVFKRASAVFQMHERAIWSNPANRNDPKHYDWLRTQVETPVYMQDKYPDVPASVRFPLDEITERFKIKYFTSSVAYALALACFLGYKRLELYGVEMETNTEYQYQRDGVALWLGIALGLGIEVDAHISVFDQPLYGYEGEVVMPYERITERLAELAPKVEEASRNYIAAIVNVQQALRAFTADASTENENRLFKTVEDQVKLGEVLGMLDGAFQENKRYQVKADKMIAASDGFLFSRQEFESSAAKLREQTEAAKTDFVSIGTTLGLVHENLKRAAKGSPKRTKLVETFEKTLQGYLQANNRLAVFKGATQENFVYMAWMDKHIRAAGGSKSEAVLLESMRANVAP